MIAIVLIATAFADDAVTQVARTLDNLLASIEDESRVEETAFSARLQWCKEAQEQGASRLAGFQDQEAQAKADVQEVTAAADEIGAATAKMRSERNATAGSEGRSLDQQLAAELPLLSSKRTAATELTRKAVDLRHVVAAEQAANAEVAKRCAAVAAEHKQQTDARLQAHQLLEQAKQLLAPPSFVQVEMAQAAADRAAQGQQQRGAAKLQKLQAQADADPIDKAQAHLHHLLTALEAPADGTKQLCAKELKANKLALVWKQDELARLAADTKAHAQAIEEATAELSDVQQAVEELKQHEQALADQQQQDGKQLEKRAQDHALLVKVVQQAVTVLKEAGAPVAEAGKVLAQAGQLLQTTEQADQKALKDLQPAAQRAQRSVEGARKAVELEASHLSLAQSQHTQALADLRQQQDQAKDELAKVEAYTAELEKTCTPSQDDAARKRKEIETVEDAMRSIGGDAPVRVQALQPAAAGDMSPLQRAAYEMGVATQA